MTLNWLHIVNKLFLRGFVFQLEQLQPLDHMSCKEAGLRFSLVTLVFHWISVSDQRDGRQPAGKAATLARATVRDRFYFLNAPRSFGVPFHWC